MIHTIRPAFAWSATALALALTMAGCSSSSSGDPETTPGDTAANDGTTSQVTPPPTTGGAPIDPNAEGSAGVWVGDFGFGSTGTYVVDNDGNFYGVATTADTMISTFGNITTGVSYQGPLDNYSHAFSAAGQPGSAPGATGSPFDDPISYDLAIVPGGEIVSNSQERAISLVYQPPGTFTPATAAELEGSWNSTHSFCGVDGDPAECRQVVVDITFNADGGFSGTSDFQDAGTSLLGELFQISGAITPFGDAALADFSWSFRQGSQYKGAFYLANDGSNELVLVSRIVDPAADLTDVVFVPRLLRQP